MQRPAQLESGNSSCLYTRLCGGLIDELKIEIVYNI